MTVPLVKVGMPDREVLLPALEKVLYSGQIGEGEQVADFEAAFARTFGLPNALAMSSGTAALHAALTLCGVTAGDEVISTAMTAEPTNVVIVQTGARPVWADIDPTSGNVDPASIEAMITPRTRAIMVVHYAGLPVRLAEILAIGKVHGLPVIEDCAHALGAHYDGKPIGTLGDYGIYSLQAIKHMTTGDGGVLTLRDATQLRTARRFRWFGLERGIDRLSTDIERVGYKYNMNNIAATIGLHQLDLIERRIQQHIDNGRFFDRELARIPGLAPAGFDTVADPSYWLYTLIADDWQDVHGRLESIGVASSKLHRRNDLHSLFANSRRPLPGLDRFYDTMIHIPCGWWVDAKIRGQIVDVLAKG